MNNNKMTSIAFKINMSFWLKKLSSFLGFDVLLICIAAFTFLNWCEYTSCGKEYDYRNTINWYNNKDINKEIVRTADDIIYVITMPDGKEDRYSVRDFAFILFPGAVVLCAFQILSLFIALFNTGEIRNKLRPLNELAIKAEEMSTLSFDPNEKFESLEHAIENISPEKADSQIRTGDKDLLSIEIALNNLLKHMRDSQKQQARFVSDVSHELRTPIAVIQGYVNMLDRWGKEDQSVLEESIEALKNESEHMKELVEQLLFLARGDTGRNTLNFVQFNLAEIMKEVWGESLMIDEEHVYTFSCSNENNCMMTGDIAMVKQSARIFIQNAAKYSKKNATINLKVISSYNQVSYVIQDEGIGMSENELPHIFERFYRSDEARNGETGGSGLGLSIAKWIVDAHNGTIDVLSRPEFGTRFTVNFPIITS